MRTKKVTRYYCDHCSKGFFHKSTAARHEASCYRNPARVCPFCLNSEEYKPDLKRLHSTPEDSRHAVGGECPWCLMAGAIRNNIKVGRMADRPDDFSDWVNYPLVNFKEDCIDWHNEHGYQIPTTHL